MSDVNLCILCSVNVLSIACSYVGVVVLYACFLFLLITMLLPQKK